MNRKRLFARLAAISLIAAFALITQSVLSQQSAEELYQAALLKKEAEGDLNGAIQLFQKLITTYPENGAIAAKAQLQIGLCYEKLGRREARIAYQTVIDRYPQEREVVAAAKERISRLAETSDVAAAKPRFRKITIPFKLSWWSPTPSGPIVDFGARLSPDGRTLAFGSEGSIWVIPVPGNVSQDIAGQPRRLTEAMYAMGGGISWSADGRLIAFNAAREENSQDIYVIPSQGGEPTKLVTREPDFGLAPLGEDLSLSPDGGVLAYQSKWDGEGRAGWSRIQTIARGAASPKILTDAKSAQPAFSPDGRQIAYVSYSPMELRVIPASGGESVRVADTLNRSVSSPVWSSDGRMLAFSTAGMYQSDEIWIVPVSEKGQATATPTTLKLPRPTGMPLAGWTSDNRIGLIYGGDQVDQAIYSVPASGGGAAQVSPSGSYFSPRWSPDGERIWFLNGNSKAALGSVPADGGAVSNLATGVQPVPPGGGNVISPDGKTVVFAGFGGHGKGVNLWIMPLEAGQPTRLTEPLEGQQDRFPCWSHDGKFLLFIRVRYTQETPQGSSEIYAVSVEGGEAQPITSASDEVAYSSVACSPDGKWMAYFSHDSSLSEGKPAPQGSSANCIKIKPVDGGPSRIVTRAHHRSGHEELCWSPDGTMLAYNAGRRIWMVPVNGGKPEQVETGLDASLNLTNISWSPDGRELAFIGSRIADPELWLMEDFLPLVKR